MIDGVDSAAWYAPLLREVGEAFSNVVVIDAGLGTSMQTALFAQRFPDRYFNLGIVEQHAVGLASGLARAGHVPLVHSFSNFLTRRAHDQIAVSVAWPGCNVKLIGGSCGLHDGRNGPSHMAIDDLGSMAALPGMGVVEPGDRRQAAALLHAAVAADGPVYFRLRRFGLPPDLAPERDAAAGTSWIERTKEPAVTLVACGTMLDSGIEARAILADHAIPADLLHVAVLRPVDSGPILESAQRTGAVAIVENHVMSSGYGSIVAAALESMGVKVARLALPDRFLPAGSAGWQARNAELSAEDIAVRASALIVER
jgi:transketolase